MEPISALLNLGGKVIDKIFPNPEDKAKATLALEELKMNGELAKLANEVKFAEIDAQDRDSARKRHIALGGKFPEIFGMVIFGFTAFLVWDILKNGYSNSLDPMIAGSLLQAFVSLSIGVCGYFYGTTAGSKAKTDILAGK
jgi:hypothetical protein